MNAWIILLLAAVASGTYVPRVRRGAEEPGVGCRVGARTYRLGERWQLNRCVTMQCYHNGTGYGPISLGCPTFNQNEACVPLGGSYTINCTEYVCRVTDNGFIGLRAGPIRSCPAMNGYCMPLGSQWVERCLTYTCSVAGRNLHQGGCITHTGNGNDCLLVGERYTRDCFTYECRRRGQFYGMDIVQGGCRAIDSPRCIPEGSLYRYQCSDYYCQKLNRTSTKLSVQSKRCAFSNGACLNLGDTITHNCYNYTCAEGGIYSRAAGCPKPDSQPGCVPIGRTYMHNCFTYSCNHYGNGYRLTVSNRACRSVSGQCQAIGSTFAHVLGGVPYDRCTCYSMGASGTYIQCGPQPNANTYTHTNANANQNGNVNHGYTYNITRTYRYETRGQK